MIVRKSTETIETTQYQCEICQSVYNHESRAQQCEAQCRCSHLEKHYSSGNSESFYLIEIDESCKSCHKQLRSRTFELDDKVAAHLWLLGDDGGF